MNFHLFLLAISDRSSWPIMSHCTHVGGTRRPCSQSRIVATGHRSDTVGPLSADAAPFCVREPRAARKVFAQVMRNLADIVLCEDRLGRLPSTTRDGRNLLAANFHANQFSVDIHNRIMNPTVRFPFALQLELAFLCRRFPEFQSLRLREGHQFARRLAGRDKLVNGHSVTARAERVRRAAIIQGEGLRAL